jgi:rfaE bifunctional protein kinase chain/domain
MGKKVAHSQAITAASLKNARLLIVGDLMLDRYWFGDVNRISPEAPVPVVLVDQDQSDERLGGAANVARNARALGATTAIMGVLGTDEPGDRVEQLLHAAGIETFIVRDEGCPTTIKLRVLGRQQQLLRIDFEKKPSNDALAAKLEQFAELLPKFDVIVLSDYGKGALGHVTDMIRLAREAGKMVLIDPKGEDFTKYAGASLLTPNRSELRQVVGRWSTEEQLRERAQALRERLNLGGLLLTRSEEGMTLYRQGDEFHVPAQAREVFDVSGAGDTVLATLATAIASGADLHSAVALANKAGGIVVGKLGTAIIQPEELFGDVK